MIIERDISTFLHDNATWYPVVSVTGPRQSGKSTLVKELFPDFKYVNLEDERTYSFVTKNPGDFIYEHDEHIIIDEAQRAPSIFNAIQVASDERGTVGQYVLSGSQNFLLLKNITQSLAGRVGLIQLLPFSFVEARRARPEISVDDFTLQGGYPRTYTSPIPLPVFFRNYLRTYIERDVNEYIHASNLKQFRTFLKLCAHNAGNLLNVSRLAKDVGIARQTVEAWLSLLESSYIIFRLPPYYTNLRKRLVKTSKLYFYDTGLLCHLLGIATPEQLRDSPQRGAIFENMIIQEAIKHHNNKGDEAQLFFYRDESKVEIDLIDATDMSTPQIIEIKSSQTFQPRYMNHLKMIGDALDIPVSRRHLVMRGELSMSVPEGNVVAAKEWLTR